MCYNHRVKKENICHDGSQPFSQNQQFQCLSADEISTLASLAKAVEFSPAQAMPFKDDDKNHIFYMITSGYAKLAYQKHTQHPLRICGPGDILGYGEWNCKFPHKAESLDTVQAWVFTQNEFQKFLYRSPNLQDCMFKIVCNILALKDERISALENHSVRNRVASVLISLSDKFGKESPAGLRIDVKLDRETMAKLAGTVTESLSRQLSELESEDIIQREGRYIYIRNRIKLEERSLS